MYYSVFFKLKTEENVRGILNFSSKVEIVEKIYNPYKNSGKLELENEIVSKEDIEFLQIVETGLQAPENYLNVKRYIKETKQLGEKFLNERFPNYYAKDITDEI
ncbi:hypothetical protein [Fusobacterium sp.]|uniref:hypothetical protein n=1 Tax=Fusobacterium sp. TaxID=68766 RepID=UPI0025C04791|nr:hypothetical protein [Fusobacterium sp.]